MDFPIYEHATAWRYRMVLPPRLMRLPELPFGEAGILQDTSSNISLLEIASAFPLEF